jgi:phage terminase large subunit GpA-like protein
MDAFADGGEVVFMKSSQVGATEVLNNFIGYIIDQDPGPTMVVQPTIEMAKAWSKDRLDPMLRDTPCLRAAVTDNQKDSDNTILHKRFRDGHLTIVGANSAANLRSRPIRNVLLDEIDAYPPHLDSVGLAVGRAKGFANRRIYKASTPEIKGSSRIEVAFEASNMQFYFVPCPHCDAMQRLLWEQLRWSRELPGGRRVPAVDPQWKGRGRHLPDTAVYVCEHCGAEITHHDKARMLARGEWRATAPDNGVDGFHINELYSPLVTWAEMVTAWVSAKALPESLKKFINESLGLSWEEQADKHDPQTLRSRAEPYRKAPAQTLLAGLSADVQDDRIEIEVVGWGRMFESWSLDWRQFLGDTAFPEVWGELDEYLRRTFETEDGRQLPLTFSIIDAGHNTDMVYRFCKPRYRRGVYALKGVGGLSSGHPIVGRIKRENKYRCPVLPANVDECKNRIFGWLSLETAGPGYMHYPDNRDEEYFQQLTAEDRVERVQRGQKVRAYVQRRARNEALDLRVYNLVGIELLQPKWDTLAKRAVAARGNESLAATDETVAVAPLPPPKVRRSPPRPNWVTQWR